MSEVADNPARHRYEMKVEGTVAFIEYTREGDRIVLTHTEVPDAFSGHGVGSRIVRSVLDDVRARRLYVVPECEFVAGFIARHPEYRSLVAQT